MSCVVKDYILARCDACCVLLWFVSVEMNPCTEIKMFVELAGSLRFAHYCSIDENRVEVGFK